MELETQVQVSGNQLKRQDEDKKELREQLDKAEQRERELSSKLREQQYRYSDLESKVILFFINSHILITGFFYLILKFSAEF